MRSGPAIGGGHKATIVIAALWVFATALNMLKPFHMDDTAHLVIAQQIVQDPWSPMSGLLNWTNIAEPIFYTNQPHAFFYLMAAVMSAFGASVLALHLLVSVFTLAALVLIYQLARRMLPENALFVTVAIGVSPGFVINQNVMVDMPLLALICLAIWAVCARPPRGALAFGALSLALLTKYTSLFLLPVLAVAAAIRGRMFWWVILPVVALVGWSLFNIADFGQAHILNRPTSSDRGLMPSELLTIGLIGALASFSLPLFCALVSGPWRLGWALVAFFGGLGWVVVWSLAWPAAGMGWLALNAVFIGPVIAVGMSVLREAWIFLRQAISALMAGGLIAFARENHTRLTHLLWVAGGGLFLVTFAPFMATRHALLIIVPFALLALRHVPEVQLRRPLIGGGLIVWAAISVVLVLNDRAFANFYARAAGPAYEQAASLAAPDGAVYALGHWGWQYYIEKAGALVFDTQRSQPTSADIVLEVPFVDQQVLPDADAYREVARIVQPSGIWTQLDTRVLYAAGATPTPFLAPAPPHRIVFLQRAAGGE